MHRAGRPWAQARRHEALLIFPSPSASALRRRCAISLHQDNRSRPVWGRSHLVRQLLLKADKRHHDVGQRLHAPLADVHRRLQNCPGLHLGDV